MTASALATLTGLVEGRLPPAEFARRLGEDRELEAMLMSAPAPTHAASGPTLYYYLIELNLLRPGDVLNAQAEVARHLEAQGCAVRRSKAPAQRFEMLLAVQPPWLSADEAYTESLLSGAPALPRGELQAWLRRRILEVFRFQEEPPRWIQSPEWPMGVDGPMHFLGQIPIADWSERQGTVFVVLDRSSGACTTIVQVM